MTVTPEEYARRISVFTKIETDYHYPLVSKVYIGNKVGLINLNGEFIVPLQDEQIILYEGYFRYIHNDQESNPAGFDKETKFYNNYFSIEPFVPGILIDLKTSEIYKNVSRIHDELYAPLGDERVPNIQGLKRLKLLDWERWKIFKEKEKAKIEEEKARLEKERAKVDEQKRKILDKKQRLQRVIDRYEKVFLVAGCVLGLAFGASLIAYWASSSNTDVAIFCCVVTVVYILGYFIQWIFNRILNSILERLEDRLNHFEWQLSTLEKDISQCTSRLSKIPGI
jgi:hypothetical protein